MKFKFNSEKDKTFNIKLNLKNDLEIIKITNITLNLKELNKLLNLNFSKLKNKYQK